MVKEVLRVRDMLKGLSKVAKVAKEQLNDVRSEERPPPIVFTPKPEPKPETKTNVLEPEPKPTPPLPVAVVCPTVEDHSEELEELKELKELNAELREEKRYDVGNLEKARKDYIRLESSMRRLNDELVTKSEKIQDMQKTHERNIDNLKREYDKTIIALQKEITRLQYSEKAPEPVLPPLKVKPPVKQPKPTPVAPEPTPEPISVKPKSDLEAMQDRVVEIAKEIKKYKNLYSRTSREHEQRKYQNTLKELQLERNKLTRQIQKVS